MVTMGNKRDVDIAYIAEARDIDGLENPDDSVIVQIDTGERTGRLRVMLNEGVIHDGDPEKGSTVDDLVRTFRRVADLEAAAMQLALDLGSLRADLAGQLEYLGVKL